MIVGVHQSSMVGGEGDTIVMHGVDVVEDIQCSLRKTQCWLICVGGKEGVGRGNVRVCSRQQPTNAANETLISFRKLDLRRRVISIDRWHNESIGIPDQYGVAVGVSSRAWQAKLLTRFVAKPDWLRWTVTEEWVMRQEK